MRQVPLNLYLDPDKPRRPFIVGVLAGLSSVCATANLIIACYQSWFGPSMRTQQWWRDISWRCGEMLEFVVVLSCVAILVSYRVRHSWLAYATVAVAIVGLAVAPDWYFWYHSRLWPIIDGAWR